MRLSLMTLGDHVTDPVTGVRETPTQRTRSVVDAAAAADAAGYYGVYIGEHHGMEYTYSAPPVMLAAIAERTKNLQLGTAITLAANLDPLRVAEDYATLDCLSGGRVDMGVGRGNFFAATYAMFGQNAADSHELFRENIELILDLWSGRPVTFEGRFRAPLKEFTLQPPLAGKPRMWIGGGASEQTLDLAARLGLDLMLPSAFGNPAMFVPVVEKFLEKFASHGHQHQPRIGACWHMNVGPTSQGARERWAPRYQEYFNLMVRVILSQTDTPPPFISKPFDFDWLTQHGPAIVGSPEEVTDRLGTLAEMLHADVNLVYLDMGGQPAAEYEAMVELIGSEVLPKLD